METIYSVETTPLDSQKKKGDDAHANAKVSSAMLRYRVSVLIFGAVLATVALACGNPATTAQQTQTAQAVVTTPAATPTTAVLAPVATPPSPPQVSGLTPATPVTVAPLTAGMAGARTDCPAGWVTYTSAASKVSLCSPADFTVKADVDENGAPGIVVSSADAHGVPRVGVPGLLVAARLSPNASLDPANPNLPLARVCTSGGHPEGVPAQLTVGGLDARGCQIIAEKNSPDGPLESLILVAQVAPSLYLNVDINWRTQSTGAYDLAFQIARTLRVSP
ncbi:MAG: hypothetical protein ACYDEB_08100 [Dehalococcoidia bacterium]